jgi:hypothetical protein
MNYAPKRDDANGKRLFSPELVYIGTKAIRTMTEHILIDASSGRNL